jgi:flavin-dependent dehydrogenase
MGSPDWEVAVVGGGPAGATAAITLARLGRRVGLVEQTRYEGLRVGETLPPAVQPALERLGLWDAFTSLGAVPSCGNQSAWGGPELYASSFIFSAWGSGWHVDRGQLDAMLMNAAGSAGATVWAGRRVTECETGPDGSWRLSLRAAENSTEIVTARAVIDATGRRAALAHRVGASRRVYDRLIGVAVVHTAPASDAGFTLVEASATGWWYSAPLPGGRLMVTFMTDADLCRAHGYAEPEVWAAEMNRTDHTSRRVGGGAPLSRPRVASAVSQRLRRYERSCPSWLAAGDAAMGVDPLSSSGVIRALQTGEAAGFAMARWLEGDSGPARAYEQELDAEFVAYLEQRELYYGLESRWRDGSFWRRRHPVGGVSDGNLDRGEGGMQRSGRAREAKLNAETP